jgi:hypothetical protein
MWNLFASLMSNVNLCVRVYKSTVADRILQARYTFIAKSVHWVELIIDTAGTFLTSAKLAVSLQPGKQHSVWNSSGPIVRVHHTISVVSTCFS